MPDTGGIVDSTGGEVESTLAMKKRLRGRVVEMMSKIAFGEKKANASQVRVLIELAEYVGINQRRAPGGGRKPRQEDEDVSKVSAEDLKAELEKRGISLDMRGRQEAVVQNGKQVPA